MERFDIFFKHTMKWEGGDQYHEVPGDPGGATKYGISQKAYPELDIEELTYEQALAIYHEDYYPSYIDAIEHDETAGRLFDFGVNAGPARAAKVLQTAANDELAGRGDISLRPLKVDGQVGPATLRLVNALGADMYDEFHRRIAEFYTNLAARPQLKKFLRGWLNRLNDPIMEN
jgi:lysozyme family protein